MGRLFIILLQFSTLAVLAQGLDVHDQKALSETQQLLKDKNQRDEFVSHDDKAKAADDFLKSVLGKDNTGLTEDIYALAGEVFAQVVEQSQGDIRKMQELLANFQRNPASFAETWSPEQKAKLKSLAEKLNKPQLSPK